MCGELPCPGEAKVTFPGSRLAFATRSATECNGEEFGTTSTLRHRGEIGQRIAIDRFKEVAVDGQSGRGDVHGVAVGSGAGDEVRGDIAAGARLVSMTTCWPQISESRAPIMRPMPSMPPPGVKGTTSLTTRLGQPCAVSAAVRRLRTNTAEAAGAKTPRRSSLPCVCHVTRRP